MHGESAGTRKKRETDLFLLVSVSGRGNEREKGKEGKRGRGIFSESLQKHILPKCKAGVGGRKQPVTYAKMVNYAIRGRNGAIDN
jgi:hypothetical protein